MSTDTEATVRVGEPRRWRHKGRHFKWHPGDGCVFEFEPRPDSSRIRVLALVAEGCARIQDARQTAKRHVSEEGTQ